MPSVSLHLVLADRALTELRRRLRLAPFRPDAPSCIDAFYHGALGPDMGYFPGGHRPLSDLAHRVRSADLTRALVSLARSPMERAFSWGWVTHVLADSWIHPLIGLGVGEVVHGDRTLFVDGTAEPAVHVRVETGLDTVYLARHPQHRWRRIAPVFDADSVGFIASAYEQVHALRVEPAALAASHRSVARIAFGALATTGALAHLTQHGPIPAPLGAARWLLERIRGLIHDRLGLDAPLLAYLNPIPPAAWLVRRVDEVVNGFAELFAQHFSDGLASLPNRDLDTGWAESPLGLATWGRLAHPASLADALGARDAGHLGDLRPAYAGRTT